MNAFRKIIQIGRRIGGRVFLETAGSRSSVRGFTLIETMIALSIFTIGIMAVGAMLIYSMRTRVLNHQINFAVSVAYDRVEELRKISESEVDARYNSVLNFNYILSRDPAYGAIDGYTVPGFLSGATGYTAAVTSITAKGISADEKQQRRDKIKILYDDGDIANHGDETSGDGIWTCIEYIDMDTGEVKPQPEYAALTAAEKKKWRWVLTRKTIVEPMDLVEVTGETYKRTLSHAALSGTVTDTTGADVAQLTVISSWADMTGKTREIKYNTLLVRGSY
ncbi:MAG: prepilin-type N-terminal cleavage/methylation domain-containing protein [Deltaproteobacteria bacterium]|nr:prepilin-type N-terminal cleavage/methylation domain-containing protein [Candidatus Zymogenaceae bacterium]